MQFRNLVLTVALALSLAALSGCDTAKERAERHYKSGMAFLQKGDVDRALLEFRNVFKLDGEHRDARFAYARTERRRGHLTESYRHYQRLAEQYPELVDARIEAAEVAADLGNWREAARHVDAGLAAAPDDLRLKAMRVAADYALALPEQDAPAMHRAAAAARPLLDLQPGNLYLHHVIVDDLVRAGSYGAALEATDRALAAGPQDKGFHYIKLSLLGSLHDDAGVEALLIEMVRLFPDDHGISETLQRWYAARGELDKAEAHLRSRSRPDAEDPTGTLDLVRFLAEQRGRPAAIAELDRLIAAGADRAAFRTVRAGMLFEEGERSRAIADLDSLLADARPSEETNKVRTALARMLQADGNEVGARALVEEVLAEDKGNVEALKLKAGWLIEDDRVDESIAALRLAIDENPRDPALMTLMARAHERAGSRELMGEMLALAVTASGRAPAESIRYAVMLAQDGRFGSAEGVLLDALRLAPGDVGLLAQLGRFYVTQKDWPRAGQVADRLAGFGKPELEPFVTQLRAAILQGQERAGEALKLLEDSASAADATLGAQIALIRARLAQDDIAGAKSFADQLVRDQPADPQRRFVAATVNMLAGDFAAARADFRMLVEEDPSRVAAWVSLYRATAAAGDAAGAAAVVDEGLAAVPGATELMLIRAGLELKAGDAEAAIATYEALYDADSANDAVANNLASLLTSYRKDPDSYERAFTVARRLRGSEFAPYQDTYGWIAQLRGDPEEALKHLEPAARVLERDAAVQFHLAEVLRTLGRRDEAAERYRVSLALAGEGDTGPFVAEARAALDALDGSAGN